MKTLTKEYNNEILKMQKGNIFDINVCTLDILFSLMVIASLSLLAIL